MDLTQLYKYQLWEIDDLYWPRNVSLCLKPINGAENLFEMSQKKYLQFIMVSENQKQKFS